MRENPMLSSEMLHKSFGRKGSVAKKKTLLLGLKELGAKMN
jgi:hypothetical protein